MLSPIQRVMIAALCRSDPIPARDLVGVIYGCRRDGGPLDASTEIRKQVLKIRQKLARLGVEVETVGDPGSHNRGYRIRPEHVPLVRAAVQSGT